MKKTMNMRLALTVIALGALTVAACSTAVAGTIETVSPQKAAETLAVNPEAILLDIRTPEEFASERIPGAVNVDFYAPDFKDQLADLDPDASYVVYCRSGNRSAQAMPMFDQLGFSDLLDVDGGIVAWYESGLPIEG